MSFYGKRRSGTTAQQSVEDGLVSRNVGSVDKEWNECVATARKYEEKVVTCNLQQAREPSQPKKTSKKKKQQKTDRLSLTMGPSENTPVSKDSVLVALDGPSQVVASRARATSKKESKRPKKQPKTISSAPPPQSTPPSPVHVASVAASPPFFELNKDEDNDEMELVSPGSLIQDAIHSVHRPYSPRSASSFSLHYSVRRPPLQRHTPEAWLSQSRQTKTKSPFSIYDDDPRERLQSATKPKKKRLKKREDGRARGPSVEMERLTTSASKVSIGGGTSREPVASVPLTPVAYRMRELAQSLHESAEGETKRRLLEEWDAMEREVDGVKEMRLKSKEELEDGDGDDDDDDDDDDEYSTGMALMTMDDESQDGEYDCRDLPRQIALQLNASSRRARALPHTLEKQLQEVLLPPDLAERTLAKRHEPNEKETAAGEMQAEGVQQFHDYEPGGFASPLTMGATHEWNETDQSQHHRPSAGALKRRRRVAFGLRTVPRGGSGDDDEEDDDDEDDEDDEEGVASHADYDQYGWRVPSRSKWPWQRVPGAGRAERKKKKKKKKAKKLRPPPAGMIRRLDGSLALCYQTGIPAYDAETDTDLDPIEPRPLRARYIRETDFVLTLDGVKPALERVGRL